MTVLISKDAVREPLYVIVPVFNPWRWKTRFKHAERAIKHFIDSGVVVYLVEIAFNRREFVFADSGIDGLAANCGVLGSDHNFRHRYIPLRTKDELWLKENAINVGVQHLPPDWQQVAWLDGDIHFVRPNWAGECIQKLQHYAFLQMFSHARDVGPNYELLPANYPHADGIGFVRAFTQGVLGKPAQVPTGNPEQSTYGYGAGRMWPGLAWACTRQAWDAVGGLPDFHIWGGGDFVMGHALVGMHKEMMRNDLHPNYRKLAYAWYESCERHIRRNVGMMDGTVLHHFHGRKSARGYASKHSLLAQIGFDPIRHLKRDYQGLWQLNDLGEDSHIKLRDTMRVIAKERNEDSPETGLAEDSNQGH